MTSCDVKEELSLAQLRLLLQHDLSNEPRVQNHSAFKLQSM